MVANPNETWGEFFKSMINLREPQLVPVTSLPPEQRPENRRFNGIRYMLNWRAQNYNETWKPVSQSTVFAENEVEELGP